MTLTLDNEDSLDVIQAECYRILDNKYYSEEIKNIMLEIGANIFVLQCNLNKYGSIYKVPLSLTKVKRRLKL